MLVLSRIEVLGRVEWVAICLVGENACCHGDPCFGKWNHEGTFDLSVWNVRELAEMPTKYAF